ncbi:MAG TPA: LuxR C-terminal-related transcriptional regulator [Gaiellaceae bacterium]|nr:LuxR C-terminal-related transcriptional regulator [Gaiellaceae bacterium]
MKDLDVTLIDRLGVPASLHDVEGRFVHMNKSAEQVLGKPIAELRGHRFTEPLAPEARESVEAHFRRAVERREPADFETLFVDANGEVRGVRAQHLPLVEGDAVVGVLILGFDVRQSASRPAIDPAPRLTPRQREILELLASGSSTAEIAQQLTLSTETVRNHLRSVLRELNAHTRVEAIAAAQRLGLLASPPLRP